MGRLIDDYLTAPQAAEELGVVVDQIYRLVRQKRLRHHRIGAKGGFLRFRKEDLAAYLESTAVNPVAPRRAGTNKTHKLKHLKG